MSENPYEAPRYDAPFASLTYYQTLSTKLNLREYRRISKNWAQFFVGVCFKFLRIRLPLTFAFADTSHFRRIEPHDLSDRVRTKLMPLADEALALDLKYAFSYWFPTVGTLEGAAAAFFSHDGLSILLIVYVRTWTQYVVDEKNVFAFVSRLADETALGTSGAKGDLDSPPQILGESHPGKSMAEVYERHRERLRAAGSPVLTVHDADQLEQVLRQHERESFDFNVERGVYVPVSQGKLERLQRLAVAMPADARGKPRQQLQGVEMICWIVLAISLLMFTRDQPANAAQTVFRVSILLAALAGIAIVWLIRGVKWMRRKPDEQSSF